MSTTTLAPSARNNHSYFSTLVHTTTEIVKSGATGAAAGWIYQVINPLGGFVFGTTFEAAGRLSAKVIDLVIKDNASDSPQKKLAILATKCALLIIAAITAAVLVTNACGIPITALEGIAFFASMIMVKIAIPFFLNLAKNSCKYIGSAIGGGILAIRDRC